MGKRGPQRLDAEQAERIPPTPETALKLAPDPLAVFEMISDLHPPHWVDVTYKLRPGTAAEWLIQSLHLYGDPTARPAAD